MATRGRVGSSQQLNKMCLCGKVNPTEENSGLMIACDGCNTWFHGMCDNITVDKASALESYLCDECKSAGVQARKRITCSQHVRLSQAGILRTQKTNNVKCSGSGTKNFQNITTPSFEPVWLDEKLSFFIDNIQCLKRVPKASRNNLARALIDVLNKVIAAPSELANWCSLHTLARNCLNSTSGELYDWLPLTKRWLIVATELYKSSRKNIRLGKPSGLNN